MTVALKSWTDPFEALWHAKKTAEVRRDDRAFRVGDRLLLREWFPEDSPLRALQPHRDGYTGRYVEVKVTHIERGFGLPTGLVVLSFARLSHGYDPEKEG
jgi:Domain of unknown function (DUF3850)